MIRVQGDALLLSVAARPGASRSAVQGLVGDALKVAIQAPPEQGKANKALTAFLAKALGLRKAQVTLASGASSRNKTLRIEGLDEAGLRARLEALLS